jgi:hypothetical protein
MTDDDASLEIRDSEPIRYRSSATTGGTIQRDIRHNTIMRNF